MPFPAGRVILNPHQAETVVTLETTEHAAPLPLSRYMGEVHEVYATGLRLRCGRLLDCESPPEEGVVINVTVRAAGLVEEEGSALRARIRHLEQRSVENEKLLREQRDEIDHLTFEVWDLKRQCNQLRRSVCLGFIN